MQRLRNPHVKQDSFVPFVKGRGYQKWTEHKVYLQVSMAIIVIKEHKIFAVLKLSLTMKLGYFNFKLFDKGVIGLNLSLCLFCKSIYIGVHNVCYLQGVLK